MSTKYDDWDDDDLDAEDTQHDSGDDLVKKLRKADRAKEKRIKELEAKLNEFSTKERASLIQSVLSERGINPKVAAFVPADIDFSKEAVNRWIEEHGDVFGVTPTPEQTDQVDPQLARLRQIDDVASSASPALSQSLLSQISNADSMEELMNVIYSN